ncbi:unnamed protein product, partial [Iphiclides podalirius]
MYDKKARSKSSRNYKKSTACDEGVAVCCLLHLPRAGVESTKCGIHAQVVYGLRVDVFRQGLAVRWWYPPGMEKYEIMGPPPRRPLPIPQWGEGVRDSQTKRNATV